MKILNKNQNCLNLKKKKNGLFDISLFFITNLLLQKCIAFNEHLLVDNDI